MAATAAKRTASNVITSAGEAPPLSPSSSVGAGTVVAGDGFGRVVVVGVRGGRVVVVVGRVDVVVVCTVAMVVVVVGGVGTRGREGRVGGDGFEGTADRVTVTIA